MNKKTTAKAAIDAVMAVLFLLLMNTAVTGLLLHEILGIAILALFAVHLSLNKNWLRNAVRRMKAGVNRRQRGKTVLNAAIAVSMSACIVTGVMISQYLFAPLGQSSAMAWYDVHDISAWVSLSLLALHGVLHWRWVAGVLRKFAEQAGRVKAAAARVGVGLLAAATVLSLFTSIPLDALLPDASAGAGVSLISDSAAQSDVTVASTPIAETQPTTQTVTATPQPAPEVTLDDYLSKLFCTGCHDRCPLTNPRCGKGVRRAEQATQEYYQSIESA